jgi:hypothetical protein
MASRGRRTKGKRPPSGTTATRRAKDSIHAPVFFQQMDGRAPARDFLNSTPTKVRALMRAVIVAVATAPPTRFSGGGYWEAMHGDMTGWFEIRVDGPGKRAHYRLFCSLDYEALNESRPLLVMIAGLSKPVGTTLNPSDYASIKAMGAEYLRSNPRRFV